MAAEPEVVEMEGDSSLLPAQDELCAALYWSALRSVDAFNK